MTDTELDALESLAKAATPGPWYAYTDGSIVWEKTHEIHTAVCDSGEKNKNNAAFIAAANPAKLLELIEELRDAKAERDWIARKYTDAFNALGRPDRMTVAKVLTIAKEATCQKN